MANGALELIPTRCAICGTQDAATPLWPARFDAAALDPRVFSARRLPDRVHYAMVKCSRCGLVRSDPVAAPERIAALYTRSAFTYGDEVADLCHTYGRYLGRVEAAGARRDALLEIGCGNGFFLEAALERGWRTVRGVEPSHAAIEAASPRVRGSIVCDVMREGLLGAERFDAVCLFQVLDHAPDPGALLDACRAALSPGGFVLAINHDVDALPARLLGERSPIVDIEHTYLYNPRTMKRLFERHGFEVREQGAVWNRYALRYLVRLLPGPAGPKRALVEVLRRHALGRWRLSLPLGNLYLIACRPEQEGLASAGAA